LTTLDYRRDRAGGVNGAAQVNGETLRVNGGMVML